MGGQTALMSFWHRPLHAMTDAFTAAGFRISVINEPQPVPTAHELSLSNRSLLPSAAPNELNDGSCHLFGCAIGRVDCPEAESAVLLGIAKSVVRLLWPILLAEAPPPFLVCAVEQEPGIDWPAR
jgi:hypothetical protein